MKIRQGFVSNSSSTSFIIAYEKGLSISEFRNELKNVSELALSLNHALYEIRRDVIEELINCAFNDKQLTKQEYIEFIADDYDISIEEARKDYEYIPEDNIVVQAESDYEGILSKIILDIDTGKIIIKKTEY